MSDNSEDIQRQAKELTGLDYYFAGDDYQPERDKPRLSTQFERILNLMLDGQWRTLRDIEDITHYPQASISAQLRNARKADNGGYTVERQHINNGLYTYRVLNPTGQLELTVPAST